MSTLLGIDVTLASLAITPLAGAGVWVWERITRGGSDG